MTILRRKRDLIFGFFIGAWLGLIYAWVTQWVNWIFLPGIPLKPPADSLEAYLLQYGIAGAFIGMISAVPENRPAGMALGGLTAAVGMSLIAFSRNWGTDAFGSTLITMLVAFLPLMVLMMPVAYLVRIGVDAQHVPQDEPHLWARRFLIPLLLTLLVVAIGTLALYSPLEREGFRVVNIMIQQSKTATAQDALPLPLQRVEGYAQNATGAYQLEYSDRIDTFMGPIPVGAELSYFMIVARFENGFSFACVFSSNMGTPSCANY